ncbi:MAG: hypothetical protein G01um10145_344 [Microgenomates group bacterium Gr01-1014_5]|nr:MAG: hypothetical protein G01um10145_344 [Microgenomates group bacterium Gr01-1014_5]
MGHEGEKALDVVPCNVTTETENQTRAITPPPIEEIRAALRRAGDNAERERADFRRNMPDGPYPKNIKWRKRKPYYLV